MNKTIQRFLGLLAISGGAIGLSAILSLLSQISGVINILVVLLFAVLFLFSLYCGMLLLENLDRETVELNKVLWMFQIPLFNSFLLGYTFSAGSSLAILIQSEFNLGAKWNILGSQFHLNILSPVQNSFIGVNLLAIGIVIYLNMVLKRDSLSDEIESLAAIKTD